MPAGLRDPHLHHVEHGTGVPLIALHGAGVDHREIEAAIEAVIPHDGVRRIYPDLPGMGRSPVGDLSSNDEVVSLLAGFVEGLAAGPVLLLGHSYGAYLARGLAARRPDLLRGLALLCPVGEGTTAAPEPVTVHEDADAVAGLDPGLRAGFAEYFVVRTERTARRYRDAVVPGTAVVDEPGLGRIFTGWTIELPATSFALPALIVAGRQDSTAGYVGAMELLASYPGASLVVADGAGHALMHERPDLLAAVLTDWLERASAGTR